MKLSPPTVRACLRLGALGRARSSVSRPRTLLQWQEGAPLPTTVGALWTHRFSGRAPMAGRHPHPTVSRGTPPVSLASAWQEAVLGREGRSENKHQAGPPEHNPLPRHRWRQCSHPSSLCCRFPLRHHPHRQTQHSSASGAGPGSLSGPLRTPHLSCGEEKAIPSPPPCARGRKRHSFFNNSLRRNPLFGEFGEIQANPSVCQVRISKPEFSLGTYMVKPHFRR